jgi:hypothetical protein
LYNKKTVLPGTFRRRRFPLKASVPDIPTDTFFIVDCREERRPLPTNGNVTITFKYR